MRQDPTGMLDLGGGGPVKERKIILGSEGVRLELPGSDSENLSGISSGGRVGFSLWRLLPKYWGAKGKERWLCDEGVKGAEIREFKNWSPKKNRSGIQKSKNW